MMIPKLSLAVVMLVGAACADRDIETPQQIEENYREQTVQRIVELGRKGVSPLVLAAFLDHSDLQVRLAAGLTLENLAKHDFGFRVAKQSGQSKDIYQAVTRAKQWVQSADLGGDSRLEINEYLDRLIQADIHEYRGPVLLTTLLNDRSSVWVQAVQILSVYGQDAWQSAMERLFAYDLEKAPPYLVLFAAQSGDLRTLPYLKALTDHSIDDLAMRAYMEWAKMEQGKVQQLLLEESRQTSPRALLCRRLLLSMNPALVLPDLIEHLRNAPHQQLNELLVECSLLEHEDVIRVLLDRVLAEDGIHGDSVLSVFRDYSPPWLFSVIFDYVRHLDASQRIQIYHFVEPLVSLGMQNTLLLAADEEAFPELKDDLFHMVRLMTLIESKPSVHFLIKALPRLEDDDTMVVFDGLEELTGKDFKTIAPGNEEWLHFLDVEIHQGKTQAESRVKWMSLEAQRWWYDHRGKDLADWWVAALNTEDFRDRLEKKVPFTPQQIRLIEKVISTRSEHSLNLSKAIVASGESSNLAALLNMIDQYVDPVFTPLFETLLAKNEGLRSQVIRLYCEAATSAEAWRVYAFSQEKDRLLRDVAHETMVRLRSDSVIDYLIKDLRHYDPKVVKASRESLEAITGLAIGPCEMMTGFERDPYIKPVQEWWRRYGNRNESWQKTEISDLLYRLESREDSQRLVAWQRFRLLTGRSFGQDFSPFAPRSDRSRQVEALRKTWQQWQEWWSPNSRYILDFLSGNWWLMEPAGVLLRAEAQRQDIGIMIKTLPQAPEAQAVMITRLLRGLTGQDYGWRLSAPQKIRERAALAWRDWWQRDGKFFRIKHTGV